MIKRRRSRGSALALVAVLSTTACGGGGTPTQPTGSLSEQARAYLDQLIGLMQANSINRLTIDWNMFRTSVIAQAAGAQTIPDTYAAIRVSLTLLGDGHSSFRTPTGTVIFVPNRSCSASGSSTPTLPSTVGYVKVGTFGGSGAEATGFANDVQSAIASADRDDLIGWIVDLRGNGGGNMWPMVAGVGPVLGEDVVGYFVDPTGVEAFGSTATEPRGSVASCSSVSTRPTGYDAIGREWPCLRTTALPAPEKRRSLLSDDAQIRDRSARRHAASRRPTGRLP